MSNSNQYDVALSFAGQDRTYVDMVADSLKGRGIQVFYDRYEEANLWGKNLYDHLTEVYKDRAQYTVIFISRHYKEKVWTNQERRAAQARALSESYEYILPARFDDTEVPGILSTQGYVDLRKRSPEELTVLICEKLGRGLLDNKAHQLPSPKSPAIEGVANFNYSAYNGRFRIGEGSFEFETMWTKASDTTIICYTDPPTIHGVALAPKGVSLRDITDASELDMTSRTRTAEEGRFVVLRNHKGFYAALEILDIKDDSRADDVDELEFRYWILSDGSKDFSSISSLH